MIRQISEAAAALRMLGPSWNREASRHKIAVSCLLRLTCRRRKQAFEVVVGVKLPNLGFSLFFGQDFGGQRSCCAVLDAGSTSLETLG